MLHNHKISFILYAYYFKPLRQFIKGILLVIAPSFIKKRVFAQYSSLTWKTLSESELDAELLLLEFLVNKDTVFFDIGSNKGEYAYYAGKLIPKKNIYLFEPERKLNKQLKAIFKGCHVFEIALSDTKGKHLFKIPVINGVIDNCLSSLEVENKEVNETESIVYQIETDTLDNFTRANGLTPDLMKIDVEGHELAVLKGGETYLSNRHPTLIIEIEQRHHKTISVDSIFESFKTKGYHCFYYSKKQGRLFPLDEKTYLTNTPDFFGKPDYVNNYILIHDTNKLIKGIDAINREIQIKIQHDNGRA
ncbi:MAG: FkbM family methyltransferase [Bacteroidetes bacterium]|nr:FkbM family methyltransferase [Bacteroidota bacterium]